MIELKRLPAAFYRLPSGREPVREWLLSLSDEDCRIIGTDIATAEFGWPVGMPVCRSVVAGLWEIRSHLTGGRTARVLFCIAYDHMVLLHGFEKKTQKTPQQALGLARHRMKEVTSNE